MESMNSEDHINESKPTPNDRQESNKLAEHSKQPISSPAVTSDLQPTHSYYQTVRQPAKDWWERCKPIVEITGVALLAVYTAYTIKMYHANKQAADAATSAAATAKSTLDSSYQSFKQEERAYVSVTQAAMSNPSICQSPGPKRICVDAHYVNSGHTPAIGVRFYRHATFGGDSERTIRQMEVPTYKAPD
jgi:hypothetical protein